MGAKSLKYPQTGVVGFKAGKQGRS